MRRRRAPAPWCRGPSFEGATQPPATATALAPATRGAITRTRGRARAGVPARSVGGPARTAALLPCAARRALPRAPRPLQTRLRLASALLPRASLDAPGQGHALLRTRARAPRARAPAGGTYRHSCCGAPGPSYRPQRAVKRQGMPSRLRGRSRRAALRCFLLCFVAAPRCGRRAHNVLRLLCSHGARVLGRRRAGASARER
ncbi:MAG: hypothetical protein J3K34DRAFT_162785 [Monoraphidium minutum]|nr:MAG: hypothetical protein J3K34DRAFT_162785 [Monoraphidium minutum]